MEPSALGDALRGGIREVTQVSPIGVASLRAIGTRATSAGDALGESTAFRLDAW